MLYIEILESLLGVRVQVQSGGVNEVEPAGVVGTLLSAATKM
jgi:hypothetical protein